MSEHDPKRLRDGASELSSLLEAGRNEMPSDRQMLMLAVKIGVLGGLGGAGAAGAGGAGAGGAGAGGAGAGGAGGAGAGAAAGIAGGKAVAGAVTAAKAGLAVKVIGAIAVASVAGAGAIAVSRPHVETSAPVGLVASEAPRGSADASASGNTMALASASAGEGSGKIEPVAELDAGPTPSAVSAKVPPRVSATNLASAETRDEGPEAEVKLVQRAQDALRSSRPAEALALCNDHAKRFPNGMVTQECEVIAVEALVKTGRKDEARKRADRFKARFPGSAAIRRLDVLLND